MLKSQTLTLWILRLRQTLLGARKKLLELHSDDSGSIEESKNQKAVVSVSAIPSAVISEDNISDIEVKFALWQPTEGGVSVLLY
jgi:hypothetical protein